MLWRTGYRVTGERSPPGPGENVGSSNKFWPITYKYFIILLSVSPGPIPSPLLILCKNVQYVMTFVFRTLKYSNIPTSFNVAIILTNFTE